LCEGRWERNIVDCVGLGFGSCQSESIHQIAKELYRVEA
jgi:hypothetical protein